MARIADSNEQRREACEEQIQALEQAAEAEEDSSFRGEVADKMGTIATVACVVASVALAVCTCGAATPIAALAISGAVLSSASFAQSQWQFMGDSELANAFGVGFGIAGGLCNLGAAGFMVLGTAAQAAQGAQWVRTAGAASAIVAGGAGIGAGGAQLLRADAQSEAIDYQADARQAALQQQLFQMLIAQLIDEVETTTKRETFNVEQLTKMSETQGAAMNAAAEGLV
jgi:hypothetical protein